MAVYGYCRISTGKQNIERQVRNILGMCSQAEIVKEVYTGTKIDTRKEMMKLVAKVKTGDTIIFDSVSRMARDAEKGFALYEELFRRGVNLVFIKEPHINTETYKKALRNNIALTGTNVDLILEGVNKYLMTLAKEQIKIAFDQAEKEVVDLRQRTREGIQTARLSGKQIGRKPHEPVVTKKGIEVKSKIVRYSKDFQGNLDDIEAIKLIGVARNTYYKYKKELLNDLKD